jgi:hypothetical protein
MAFHCVKQLTLFLLISMVVGCAENSMPTTEVWLDLKADLQGTFSYRLPGEAEGRRVVLDVDEDVVRLIDADTGISGGGPQPRGDSSPEPVVQLAAFPVIQHVDVVYVYSSSVICTRLDWSTRPWEERWFVVVDWETELFRGEPGVLTQESMGADTDRSLSFHDPADACTVSGHPLPDSFFSTAYPSD